MPVLMTPLMKTPAVITRQMMKPMMKKTAEVGLRSSRLLPKRPTWGLSTKADRPEEKIGSQVEQTSGEHHQVLTFAIKQICRTDIILHYFILYLQILSITLTGHKVIMLK